MPLRWFKENKRKEYRIDLQKDPSFAIGLVRAAYMGIVPGMPLNISAGGAAAAFSENLSLELKAKETVNLQITFSHSVKVLTMQARVLVSRVQDGHLLCRFQFLEPEKIRPFIEYPGEHEYLTRQHCYRVEMIEEATIEVVLGLGKNSPRGLLWDLSITGMSILITQNAAEELADNTLLRASFTLPGSTTHLIMRGKIVFRRPKDSMVIIGVQFEPNEREGRNQEEEAIASFIMRHQQKMLQKRAHLRY